MLRCVTPCFGAPSMSERGEHLAQIDRLCSSEALHGSESLCRLLRYLAQKALENPGSHVKEYQIATEVYGRPPDFNPQVDSTIRVQAARLRGKISEYYTAAGLTDPVLVDLPRGSYSLRFRHRSSIEPTSAAIEFKAPETPAPQGGRKWLAAVSFLAFLLFASLLPVAFLLRDPLARPASAAPGLGPS